MRIVIDMQGAQAESRSRGIGRYTQSLTQAIVRNRGEHEIILALSGLLPDTIEPIRASFEGLLPQKNILVWHAPAPVQEREPGNSWRRQAAELLREAFIASLQPDVVHITSLFEGYVDDAVSSIGRFDQTTPVCVTLYDLIPLLNPEQYLKPDPVYKQYYLRKIEHLRRASLLLAISESSRQEAIAHLGVAADSVTNISTAADAHFRPIAVSGEQKHVLQSKYGITRPFVMYTGGIDYRKNIDGLIRAYALLPDAVRAQHQLVVVCSIHPQDRLRLEALGKKCHLAPDELVLTGFVPEYDLLLLYNLCKMFVFPSWHEGFGLPALEAMACGRAVIASNTSSLPEVIGREDALFDSGSDASIAGKIEQVLTDDIFRTALEAHGLVQARHFSWDISARRAITVLEKWHAQRSERLITVADLSAPRPPSISTPKPKLAYVSPLPPERSGISDYSAELLPELFRHYDIDVIVVQDDISNPWVKANCPARTVEWFLDHAASYDRVLYHFGNSTFHQHMFDLLEKVPGIVVLHDFFLSGIVAHMDGSGAAPGNWAEELYHSHGYGAIRHRFHADDTADVVWAYPCNLSVLQNSKGTIVHSEPSRGLFQQWFGEGAADDCTVIPLLRVPPVAVDRTAARRTLKLDDKDFVVCSFGMLGRNKLNHRLLDSWLASELAKNPQCILVFVGESPEGEYGHNLRDSIRRSRLSTRIRITDWADTEIFRNFLAAADVGVQLRALSRGETSAAVLDCMNFGLPTIINAHGSMADLPDDGTWKLADNFSDAELIDALQTLWQDDARRHALGKQAKHVIRTCHAADSCADLYAESIEKFYRTSATDIASLTVTLANALPSSTEDRSLIEIANSISRSIPVKLAQRQLLVDISELVQRDSRSGIQRVVRSILLEWLTHPPQGFRVEPVYATEQQSYRYARSYTLGFLECPTSVLSDEPVEFRAGDRFIGIDLQPHVVIAQQRYYQSMRRQGVRVQFVVYDLLPILMPEAFIDGAAILYQAWLKVITDSDGVICISKAVADELTGWQQANHVKRLRPLDVSWFHLGADVEASVPTKGLPVSAIAILKAIKESQAFLMIGTLEPRKGHAQIVAAFETLWASGIEVMLVIVGKPGWLVDALIEKLRNHHEFGKRLIWLDGISDEYLEEIYAISTCLIAASEGEGFGLPLIEAAQYQLPIIARDIPVFREVAGEHAFYFSGDAPQALADVVIDWLHRYESDTYPKSVSMPWLTWKQSAERLLKLVLQDRKKPRLAFVSPLPPERTGIANYSAELLPALREYFDIELVTDQSEISLSPSLSDLPIRTVAWFEENGRSFDRIIYQVGNSPFHSHMLALLHRHPGVVMLHDFFLSGLLEYCELSGVVPGIWAQSLYHSHGYHALLERFSADGSDHARDKYPCNLDVLQTAKSVIVHSRHSQRLACQWYGPHAADNWHVIPHLRRPPATADRAASRKALGIGDEAFVVCSFGFVAPTKLSHRLLDAWLSSRLCAAPNCVLVLVGTNHGGEYGLQLTERIRNSDYADRIQITGWTDTTVYDQYLQAADVGVQLRSMSRGETSGAVLDCLNYGLPTIVNAHGSMADLPESAVWKLADAFTDAELINALETLRDSNAKREALKAAARELILYTHHPNLCARQYAAAIESTYQSASTDVHGSAPGIPNLPRYKPKSEPSCEPKYEPMQPTAQSAPLPATDSVRSRQLLVDVSEIARSDLHAGIERVVRAQLSQLLRNPPAGFRVEPVYLSDMGGVPHYRYAQRYTHRLLSIDTAIAEELPVTVNPTDVFYGADFCPADVIKAGNAGIYADWRSRGVEISFLIYDLLPILRPEFFPDQVDRQHAQWLACITDNADHLICISKSVADDVSLWSEQREKHLRNQFNISVLHQGADIAASFPSAGMPDDAAEVLDHMMSAPSFLMVGTIEPRKGHLQTLAAFEKIWNEGSPIKLIIVGKEGWTSLASHQRRTIPQIMEKLRNHQELGKRLIWLPGISDEYLQKIYAACTCLLFPSEAEGFGLPLIEAARFSRPIIARNIPIFREVAQENAYFFDGLTPDELACAIRDWLILHANGSAPSSVAMQWNTWAQNIEKLAAILT